MVKNERFRTLLSDGIYRIKQLEKKPISVIQDELGYAIGKKSGGSSIEHWRKGFIPGELADLAALVKVIVARSDLGTAWALELLTAAEFPYAEQFCQDHLAEKSDLHANDDSFTISYEFEKSLAYRTFIGRQQTIETILSLLTDPSVYPIIGIDGVGGMGKTALAQEVAIQCQRKQLFARILWLTAAEIGQEKESAPRSAPEIFELLLHRIGTRLGLTDLTTLPLPEKTMRVATLLRRDKILLLFDNVEIMGEQQGEVVRQLSPLLGKSRALLTSRQRFGGDLQAIHLLGLDGTAAAQFIRQEGAWRGIPAIAQASAAEIEQIVQATGGLPLAMKLVVGQLDLLPLGDVLDLLRQVDPLSASSAEDEYERFYQSIFVPSWQRVLRPSKLLLIALSFFSPGQGSTLAAANAVSGLARTEFSRSLSELWRLSLLERSELLETTLQEKRYFLHPLIRSAIQAAILNEEPPNLRIHYQGCGERFIQYYVDYTHQHSTAYRFLEQEHANLLLAIEAAFAQDREVAFLTMVERCYRYWEVRGFYKIAANQLSRAQEKLAESGDQARLATTLLQLARLAERQGQLEKGLTHAESGLRLTDLLADGRLKSELLHSLGRLHSAAGNYAQAHQALATGMGLAQESAHDAAVAAFLASIGKVYQQQSDYATAAQHYEDGVKLAQASGDEETAALLWLNLGSLYGMQGQFDRAETYLNPGLLLARALGHQEQIARFLHLLASCAIMRGDLAKGEQLCLEGLAMAEQIGHLDLTCTLLLNLGVIAGTQDDLAAAEAYWKRALAIAREMQHRERMTGLLSNLARLALRVDDLELAEAYLNEAESIVATWDNVWAKYDVRIEWGRLKFKQGAFTEAATILHDALAVARELHIAEMEGDIYWQLARIELAVGNRAQAKEWGHACLQLYRTMNHGDADEVAEWLAAIA
ncbi:MAG: tetratricopeptide repeat protein [Caldilineaceae bacterium]|nr:tetratricopeptide repeat protein [Caldilineaceae bacterium]